MARFVTIGYGDEAGYQRTAPDVRDAAHAHDARLADGGVRDGHARAHRSRYATTTPPGCTTQEGSFMTSSLPVAGFAIIEADTLAEAVEMVSRTPCAVAQGVVEVWPLRRGRLTQPENLSRVRVMSCRSAACAASGVGAEPPSRAGW